MTALAIPYAALKNETISLRDQLGKGGKMTLSLQGYLYDTAVTLLPSALVKCRSCGSRIDVTGEEIDAEEGVVADDFAGSLEAAMDQSGWERGNCPHCVETIPNLAKHDAEDDE